MREIKFRAKRTDNGAWVYGDLQHVQRINTKEQAEQSGRRSEPAVRIANYDVDEQTIGQFTELKDKNDKEIYEGDILKYTSKYKSEYLQLVVFDEGAFCFRHPDSTITTPLSSHLWHIYTVIGNIHDNPELFTTEKEQ